MFSIAQAVLIAEVPVCTTAILLSVGWVYRRNRAHDDERDKALATQSQGLAVLVAQVNPLLASVTHLDLRTGELERTTAALKATLEAVQRLPIPYAPRRPSPGPGNC